MNATWVIKWSNEARKQLRSLDKVLQLEILRYLSVRIREAGHPHHFGKPLNYDKRGLWRYRVRNTRIICQIREKEQKRTVVIYDAKNLRAGW